MGPRLRTMNKAKRAARKAEKAMRKAAEEKRAQTEQLIKDAKVKIEAELQGRADQQSKDGEA